MKFTITDVNASEMQTILRALFGSVGSTGPGVLNNASESDDEADDDSAPVNAAAPSTDSTGLPWDDRIHSSSKSLTKEGKWRGKKGIDKSIIPGIEAELRARGAVGGQPVNPAPIITTNDHVITPAAQPAPVSVGQPTSAVPMPPAPADPAAVLGYPSAGGQMAAPAPTPPQPQPASPGVPLDFNSFMVKLAEGMRPRAGDGAVLIPQETLQQINGTFQINAITDAASQPHLIPAIVSWLQQQNRWPA